jgi:hypothetical protein
MLKGRESLRRLDAMTAQRLEPDPSVPRPIPLPRAMATCAARVVRLLLGRHLHIRRDGKGRRARLPDGRTFVVFRETSCDESGDSDLATLAVWFHLRWVPAGARVRRFAFERESLLNTVLYAGFEGYRTKLWMVDPATSDYAGLYEWRDPVAAERYARYITAVLRPLSERGSVGYAIVPLTSFSHYLATMGAAA